MLTLFRDQLMLLQEGVEVDVINWVEVLYFLSHQLVFGEEIYGVAERIDEDSDLY